MNDFALSTRREAFTNIGRFRGGKLSPTSIVRIYEGEGGVLTQNIVLELDPIAGKLLTPITADVFCVCIPVPAIDYIKDPAAPYAGSAEVVRSKLLNSPYLFGLQSETDISKRLGVVPTPYAGVKRVSQAITLAHNAGVNFLRRRLHSTAAQLPALNGIQSPALLSSTALTRLNGVLDPDDRINGMVNLTFPSVNLPVVGIDRSTPAGVTGATDTYHTTTASEFNFYGAGQGLSIDNDVHVELNNVVAGSLSLVDFYNAETMHNLVQKMRAKIEASPEHGEKAILRWAHGLEIDVGREPFLLAERSMTFGRDIVSATDTDGVQGDVMRSDMAVSASFTVPVPKTEFGCIVMTFVQVKPDEVLYNMPHPHLSANWTGTNYVADQLAINPIPVLGREIYTDIPLADESTPYFYTGLNALKKSFVQYGFNRALDIATVANKTAVWQWPIPLSVTPDSILYPATLPHYPFADQLAEVVTFSSTHILTVTTPMVFGPTPVETLAVIDQADIFGDYDA